MKIATVLLPILLLVPVRVRAAECTAEFPSTFALIQSAVFERQGCTNDVCHGAAASGSLDLRAGSAHAALIDVAASTVASFKRVEPGDHERSLLWVNLAAKTRPSEWTAPLRAMPLDPVPAISDDALEAVRLWIEAGAPAEGTVSGTAELLDACLPPPLPIQIAPLPPPAPGIGVQFHMPSWTVPASSESEICFAEYYDVSDQVPAAVRNLEGTSLRYSRAQVRQNPLSHHLIMNVYRGEYPIDGPLWGEFRCRGGAHDGESCGAEAPHACGAGGACITAAAKSIGCVGFGPPDAGFGVNGMGDAGAQETATEIAFAEGVYDELPVRGLILWNSHAFNVTGADGPLEGWVNFEFAQPEQQLWPVHRITNTEEIFKMNAPAFGTDEVCHRQILPPGAELFSLSSHTHKRGKRFRTFLGAFACAGGIKDGEPCEPYGADLVSPDICAGAPCQAMMPAHVGDCDGDARVTVDEVITAVGMALGEMSIDRCADADGNRDMEISVDEIVTAIGAALSGVPAPRPLRADDSLLYVNLLYNDARRLRLDPPLHFAADSNDDERTLTFCALYDNGYSDPNEVKTRAGSPQPPFALGVGGPCALPTGCTAGRIGQQCSGRGETARNRSCDSSPGAGDGFCDGCPSVGGVTTEDEMLVLTGEYYVP